jgi:phage-related protein
MAYPKVRKPVHFIASSLKDLQALPEPVRGAFGRLLLDTQYGETPYEAKPLKGFGNAGVLELIESFDTNTYRAIYTVRLAGAIYVLQEIKEGNCDATKCH